MDNHKSEYFLYGGIFSLSIFTFIIFILYFIIRFDINNSYYTKTDNVIISVSIADIDLKAPEDKSIDKMAEPIETAQEPDENIDDIFDAIESEKIDYSKNIVVKDDAPVVDKDFLKKIQTRTDIKHEKDSTRKEQSAKELDLEYSKFKSDQKSSKLSGGVKDEYKAKVYALLYRGWTHSSKSFRSVKVDIRISSTGKMRYKIRQVSGDSLFDSTLQAHLEYLLGTIFPISPDGKSFHFEVDFTTKGK